MDSYPLGTLLVILTVIHLGAGNSHSQWLEKEEKIGVFATTRRKGVVTTQC